MVPWTGAFLILLVSAFRRDQRRRWHDLTTVIGYAVYVIVGTQLHILLVHTVRHPYDAALLRADALLGFNPVAFADAASHHGWLMVVLILAYVSVPAMIGLAWVLEQDFVMRRAVLLGGCFCFLFYAIFPAVGPGHFDWARHVPEASTPYNCMPSMHFTWSLLIAINARSRRLQVALWVYAGLIALATLALREHYLVDLLAAAPYTLAVQWLARRPVPREWLARVNRVERGAPGVES
jgi:PAP2 superfamily